MNVAALIGIMIKKSVSPISNYRGNTCLTRRTLNPFGDIANAELSGGGNTPLKCVESIQQASHVDEDVLRHSTERGDYRLRYCRGCQPDKPREQRGSDGNHSDIRLQRSLADGRAPDYLRNGDNPGGNCVVFPSAPSKSNLGRIRTQILGKLNQIFWQANQELSRSLVLRKCVETRGVPSYCNEEDGMARHSSKEEKAYSRMRVGWDLETNPRTGVLRGGVQSLSPYLLV